MSPNQSNSISFDPIAERYDETRTYPPEVAAQIARELIRLSGAPAMETFLEIGIGTGRIALPLLADGINVTGVDISSRMVERLAAKYAEWRRKEPERLWGDLRVELGDITALPFGSSAFDAVVAVHVLHLIPAWQRAIDEVLRVLKPQGVFLLGQDVRSADDALIRTQDRWREIMRSLGSDPQRAGAANYSVILADLRQRGLRVEEQIIATWRTEHTARELLRYITERQWSLTWNVPDEVFDESARQLTMWMQKYTNGALDTPQAATTSFKVARVTTSDNFVRP